MIKNRRIGRFRITVECLEDASDALKVFLCSVIILRAEYDFSTNSVGYPLVIWPRITRLFIQWHKAMKVGICLDCSSWRRMFS
jgi:hypothetical protein